MSKSGEERRKFDAETNFLYGIYAYSVQKSTTLQKLAFSQLWCNPSYQNFFSIFARIANPVFLLPRTEWSGVTSRLLTEE
jgi:hypothetical protein